MKGLESGRESLRVSLRGESLGYKAWKRFRRHKLAMFGLVVLTALALLATFAPFVSRYSPSALNLPEREMAPNWQHWLGTDRTGRDIWARVVYGGRASLSVGLVAVAIQTIIGVGIGSASGYSGGRIDLILMRLTDMVQTFPMLVIVIALVAILGPNLYNLMFAIGILGWPAMARLVRGQFLFLREMEFVHAARCVGAGPITVVFKHILPNTVGPVAVAITLGVGEAILLEAAMSFLGLGIQPPTPSWGSMLNDARTLSILEKLPWMWVSPGVMISLAVLSINFIGDGMRDALDARQQI
jgi:peptide/nickel transport system permease protein